MKRYCFESKLSEGEILALIRKNAQRERNFHMVDFMSYKITADTVSLRKLTGFKMHLLQRRFVLTFTKIEGGTLIEGRFKYPLIPSSFFLLLAVYFLYLNFNAVKAHELLVDKLFVTALFSLFYFVVFLVFFMGKVLFRKEEKAVVDFVEKLVTGHDS